MTDLSLTEIDRRRKHAVDISISTFSDVLWGGGESIDSNSLTRVSEGLDGPISTYLFNVNLLFNESFLIR